MKPVYLISILLLCLHAKSQTFYDNAPCNTDQTPSSYTFDWKTQTYTYYSINDPNPKSIQSPFYLTSLNNPNVNEFSMYTSKDYNESDGWNLVKSDFGSPSTGTSSPYFVLYNKYTGILRVFIALTQLLGQNNAALITLSYGGGIRSAQLEHYSQSHTFNPLDNFHNDVESVQNPNYFVNQENFWFHADFTMNYDPCACNFENKLQFDVSLASNSTFTFTIDGQALQNFNLSEFTDNFGRVGSAGKSSSSKGVSQFWPYTMFKDFSKGVSYAEAIYTAVWDPKPTNYKNALTTFFGGVSTLAKVADNVTSLIGLFTGASTTAPKVPIGFDIKLKGNGTMTTNNPYTSLQLVTPGSYQGNIQLIYLPEYNNGYGVFNVLNTPVI